ncbi:hypothetical protein GCK72_007844 [Caenorhabditis remanei]|uniref:Serine palmitoyltransferase 1 n=1 Tax=Caenorhabditis remanei TaxID=31234 RepID=A0A6A5HK46_CAERE|nr:hypothetical protein GCK72_007844 [Caenorhabditis remanei]KAF1767885.1 hypothetical protein GCK72_007844 [Caenorhabditis remanei]
MGYLPDSFHYYIETALVALLVWVVIRNRSKRQQEKLSKKLTERQKDELIADWHPEPLVPETPQDHPVLNPKYADGKMTKEVTIDGETYLNMASTNFLSFIGVKRIEERAKQTIFKYGVGSCGPRGFYGTVDVHLDLEKELAKFMGCEEAVLYSYGFATVSSAIPAYAKKGDVIFVDEGVNFAIQKGLQASRSRVEYFKHNDMEDLERLLLEQEQRDKKDPKKAKSVRRFIVVEGLYVNHADLCPLPKIIEFKWRYKVRVFIDESWSFGVIGKTGRAQKRVQIHRHNIRRLNRRQILVILKPSTRKVPSALRRTSDILEKLSFSGFGGKVLSAQYVFSETLRTRSFSLGVILKHMDGLIELRRYQPLDDPIGVPIVEFTESPTGQNELMWDVDQREPRRVLLDFWLHLTAKLNPDEVETLGERLVMAVLDLGELLGDGLPVGQVAAGKLTYSG